MNEFFFYKYEQFKKPDVKPTCFAVHFRVHDYKLWSKFANATTFENRHQPSKMLQIEGVARPACLWVVFRTLHCTVQPFISHCGVANKVPNVVRVWNGWLWMTAQCCIGLTASIKSLFIVACSMCFSYLDGWDECTRDIGTEKGRHVQFANISLLSQGTGYALLTEQLKASHPVLHTHHIQSWPTG